MGLFKSPFESHSECFEQKNVLFLQKNLQNHFFALYLHHETSGGFI